MTRPRKYRKRRVVLILLALLITFRLMLPGMVKGYVNKVLAELPGYTGAVQDIDISLLRGAYVIKDMHLNVLDAETEVPFLDLPYTDISIEWKSLFKGKVVSEIIMQSPKVTYVMEDQEGKEGADADDWTQALRDIVPLDINHLEIHDGMLALVEVTADPTIDLQMQDFELYANNLRNVSGKEGVLPSDFSVRAKTFGNGNFKMDGKVDILHVVPEMDVSFSLENSEATALNDFTRHYAKVDLESGIFSVFGEFAISDAYLKGYVKPFLNDIKVLGKDDPFPASVWEGFVGLFEFLLKNQRTDEFALKVPFEGSLDDVEPGAWSAFFSIFKNAFVKAFQQSTDDEIEFSDAKDRKK